ncbi:hypothetical protein LR48_Vigan06g114500 [Vigna angularis]|uniref:Uncharacterized protein n=1 Tax=Phaseolus angularis TaxID=3914 RepID=A0A0L9UTG6_PHAAN|nr:hypothetical protein LR48_Vigan06g114500 [Vigna angularis]
MLPSRVLRTTLHLGEGYDASIHRDLVLSDGIDHESPGLSPSYDIPGSSTCLPLDSFPGAWEFDSFVMICFRDGDSLLMSVMSRLSIQKDTEEAFHSLGRSTFDSVSKGPLGVGCITLQTLCRSTYAIARSIGSF